jgi:hypothetical protein
MNHRHKQNCMKYKASLGVFRKTSNNYVISVRLSVRKEQLSSNWTISMKIGISVFFQNRSKIYQIH